MKLLSMAGVLAAAMICAGVNAQDDDEKLEIGEPAPGLDIEEWVRGSETTLDEGQVYVVEFWATWCAPCRKSIPHLTELQAKWADDGLTIIGVSNEEGAVVEPFVKKMGPKMAYTVAVDRREVTNRAWMKAAKLDGIPSAFIVDRKGNIAFIGHPLDEKFEKVLRRVMLNRYDAKLDEQALPQVNAARNARKVRNWKLAEKHYMDVLKLDDMVFAEAGIELFDMYQVDMKDSAKASLLASQLIANQFADDPGALEMLAEKIATDPQIEKADRDLNTALAAAEAMRAVAGAQDPQAMSVEALVRFHRGEVDQAIALQKEAYFLAKPKKKPEFKRALDSYQTQAARANVQANVK